MDIVWFQKKSILTPMESHQKFLGGGGVLKAKLLEAKCEAKLEFPVQNRKNPLLGVYCTVHLLELHIRLTSRILWHLK